MADDKLAPILQPELIARFDRIPPDTPISLSLQKSDLAFFIKSYLSMQQTLANVLYGAAFYAEHPEFSRLAENAAKAVQLSREDFASVADRLILETVMQVERRDG